MCPSRGLGTPPRRATTRSARRRVNADRSCALIVCACVGMVFMVLLLALARLFRLSEINELVHTITKKLRARRRSVA